jgi:formate hydrogenlyase subunit 3/multisubunit Na+/H+ antiporter MnhD subunit
MPESPDPNRSPLPLNYDLPPLKKPRRILMAIGSFCAGFVVGLLFTCCISFNLWPNPNGLQLRARTLIAIGFCVIASMAIAVAVFVLRRHPGEPRNLDDIFFAGFLAGAALAFFFTGSCYAAS